MKTIPVSYLDECFAYDPQTGELIWRVRPDKHFPSQSVANRWNAKFANTMAGSKHSSGYRHVSLSSVGAEHFLVHRVVWAMAKGVWPGKALDHANGIRDDNRIANLREATITQNNYNRKIQRNSKSGFKGVYRRKDTGRYQACIRVNNIPIVLGYFATAEEANVVYQNAALKYHGEFAKTETTN